MDKEINGVLNCLVMTNSGICECRVRNIYSGNVYYTTEPDNTGNCNDYDGLNGDECWDCWDKLSFTVSSKPSDGFILAESAQAMPNSTFQPIEIQSCNHFQMRNDANLEAEFRKIFTDGGVHSYFKLTD